MASTYFIRFEVLSGALIDTWTLLWTLTVGSGGSSQGHTEDDAVWDTSSAAVGSTRVSTRVLCSLADSPLLDRG